MRASRPLSLLGALEHHCRMVPPALDARLAPTEAEHSPPAAFDYRLSIFRAMTKFMIMAATISTTARIFTTPFCMNGI